jgi:CRP-like cAMP-binding protein
VQEASPLFAFRVTEKIRGLWRTRVPPGPCRKGQVLFYQGHYPYGIFLIHSGRLELRDTLQETVIPCGLGKGTLIGIDLLQTDLPYPYTGIATEDVEASFLDKVRFFDLLKNEDALVHVPIHRTPAESRARVSASVPLPSK